MALQHRDEIKFTATPETDTTHLGYQIHGMGLKTKLSAHIATSKAAITADEAPPAKIIAILLANNPLLNFLDDIDFPLHTFFINIIVIFICLMMTALSFLCMTALSLS